MIAQITEVITAPTPITVQFMPRLFLWQVVWVACSRLHPRQCLWPRPVAALAVLAAMAVLTVLTVAAQPLRHCRADLWPA